MWPEQYRTCESPHKPVVFGSNGGETFDLAKEEVEVKWQAKDKGVANSFSSHWQF